MTIGELIWKCIEYVTSLCPVRVIDAWELGVKLRFGKIRGATLKPGLHFFLPLIETIETEDASIAAVNSETQTLETLDGVTIAVAMMARYRVVDYALQYSTIHDIDNVLAVELANSTAELVATLSYHGEDLSPAEQAMIVKLPDEVWRDLRERFADWGIELESVGVQTLCRVKPIRLIG